MPKTTRHLGTCAACEREIKVRDGKLVHHGYERPGIGYIVGDCLGVGYPPHELSPEVAQMLAEYAERDIERLGRMLDDLPNVETLPRHVYVGYGGGRLQDPYEWREVTREDVDDYTWERLYRAREEKLKDSIAFWVEQRKRAEKLVRTWRPQPLRTVQEEQAQKRAAKAEREAAKLAKWEAETAKKVAYYQKRMGSALKKLERASTHRKGVSMIVELYEDAASKVVDTMRDRITYEEARDMLGFADVYAQIGLPPEPANYRERHDIVFNWKYRR
jgi:hypothetical protein